MVLRRFARSSALALLTAALLGNACVEPFGGSNMQVDLAGGVVGPGLPAINGRPPPGTHFSFYALREEGDPVTRSFAFHVLDFEIQPVIDMSSPCFIEIEEDRFPGLHATQILNKLSEVTGISESEALDPPAGADPGDVIDVLTAKQRVTNQGRLQSAIKAVTSFSPAPPPELDTDCAEDGGTGIPPARCIEKDSNEQRLSLCRAFWAAHPSFYQGNDKVFTLPRNGTWHGAVTGNDPRNNAFVGGAGFYADTVFDDIDGLAITWQYDDVDGDGQPDYPDDLPDAEKSIIGFHYMVGDRMDKTRGVIDVPMANRVFPQITGEAAIWSNLDEDTVTF